MGTVVLGRKPNGDFGAENEKGELVSKIDMNERRAAPLVVLSALVQSFTDATLNINRLQNNTVEFAARDVALRNLPGVGGPSQIA